ncbi:MAG: carbohydrate porin, partial [Kluyvera sp.]
MSLSILAALSPIDVIAAKLTVEQRLEMLEAELSANKAALKQTQSELSSYKDKVATLQESIKENTQRNVTAGNITAQSPVADNIENENSEKVNAVAKPEVKATQQVAVIDTSGSQAKVESVTMKDISKFVK